MLLLFCSGRTKHEITYYCGKLLGICLFTNDSRNHDTIIKTDCPDSCILIKSNTIMILKFGPMTYNQLIECIGCMDVKQRHQDVIIKSNGEYYRLNRIEKTENTDILDKDHLFLNID